MARSDGRVSVRGRARRRSQNRRCARRAAARATREDPAGSDRRRATARNGQRLRHPDDCSRGVGGRRVSAPHRRALVIYARPPVAGLVKTRLQPVFTPAEGLALYEAMLADLVERTMGAGLADTTVFLAWSEPCEPPGSLSGLIGRVRVERQTGDDLGERMARTLQEKFHAGFTQVALIGADAPNLPLDYLHQAFDHLRNVDIVLGPANDGGYYLLGARRLHPVLFQKMPW